MAHPGFSGDLMFIWYAYILFSTCCSFTGIQKSIMLFFFFTGNL